MGVSVVFEGGSEPVELVPGQQTEWAMRVRNTGQVVDRILLDVLGETAGYAQVEPAQVNLLPGATERVLIRFSPPRVASLAPGAVNFGLRATSIEDPEGSSVEEGLVVIGEFSDLSAQLVPRSATGRRSAKFRLVVENRGNRPEPVRIEPFDPDDKLGFKTRPATFVAQPGTATFVRLKTIAKKDFFRGPNRTLPFQATTLPEQGEAATDAGVVVQKQILPEWLLPALGVAALAVGALAALWFVALRPVVNSAATAQGIAASAQAQASKAAMAADSARQAASAANLKSGKLTQVTVMVASPSVLTGATDVATAHGTAASGVTSNPDVVWTTSNPAVATVSPKGVVKALTPGTVTITATSAGSGSSPSTPSTPSATETPAPGASSSGSAVVSGSQTVTVVSPVSVTTAALPQAVLGKTYSQSLAGTGGTGTYTWSIDSGTLPPGFTLSPDGILSGTGTAVTSSTFKVQLVNGGPPYQSATKTFTLPIIDAPAVETSSLPGATIATLYNQTLTAVFGTAPYKWALVPGQGTLPDGMTLNQTTGVISGNPSTIGVFTFSVQVTDSAARPQSGTQQLSIAVASPLAISTAPALPQEAVKNQPFSLDLGATGGIQPYTWSLVSGGLPLGLNLATNGTISGTPASTGKTTFTVQAVSAGPPVQSVSKTLTLTVVDSPVVATSALNDATTGNAYSQTLSASFGTAPYTWSLVPGQGILPPGLSLNAKSGLISGTPIMVGSSTFTVQAVDATTPSQSATQHLSITVAGPLGISTLGLPDGVDGARYSLALSASGGTAPYTWSVSTGSLPDGLSLDPASGLITGTPSKVEKATFTVNATDAGHPTRPASQTLTLTVVPALVGTSSSLPPGAVSNEYTAQLTAVGGTGPYVWTLTGTPPPGLTLSASGQITGIPVQTGTFPFSVQITDASSPPLTVSETEMITVAGSLQITTQSLPDAEAGQAYSQTLTASGGTAPYTWSIASGSLPTGLILDPVTGVISGTTQAVAAGASVTFTVKDTGPPQQTTSRTLTVRVSSPLAFTELAPAAVVIGQPFTATPQPQGGSGSFLWSEAGALPAGLSFSSANGEISGTVPIGAKTGAYPFQITLTDSDGGLPPATGHFTLTVVAPLAAQGSLNLDGAFGARFDQQIHQTGGVAPYSYAFATGDHAPSWLSVNSSTGVISGTPDTSCSTTTDTPSGQTDQFACPPATFTDHVTITDAAGETFTVTVNLTVTTPPLVVNHVPSVTQLAGKPLNLSLGTVHSGYGGGTVTFTAAGLPCSANGMVCDQLNFADGTVTGTLPDFGAGSYNVVVTVTQDDPTPGSSNTYIGTYTVTINTASGATPSPSPTATSTPTSGPTP
jgi:hypothetical protein